jgi:hypothetical protein
MRGRKSISKDGTGKTTPDHSGRDYVIVDERNELFAEKNHDQS